MEELNFDVVVVGGGPAGSSAAHMAAKNGCTVALIEKEKEIAQTVRTSGVTWISDIKKFPASMTVEDILIQSSNIRTIKIARKIL